MKSYKRYYTSFLKILISLIALLFTINTFSQNTYKLDKNHSRLSFIAKHLGVFEVEGNFNNFDVTLKANKDDFTDAIIEMTTEAKSINTENKKRDADLRSSNFLDIEIYPKLVFKSSSFKKLNNKNYKLKGKITIHGITKIIVFDVVYKGKVLNPMSKKYSVGFTVTGKLSRKDFGVGTDFFSKIVGNEIVLKSNVAFIIN